MWRRIQTLAPALRRTAAAAGAAPSPAIARAAPLSTAAAAFRRTTPLLSGDKPATASPTVEDIMPIATGHEREELEAELQGTKRFDMDPPVGPFGTKNPLQALTNGVDPMSRVMQIRKLNDGINPPVAENELAGGDRMGGTGGFAGGDRMGGFAGGDRMSGFAGGDRMGGTGSFAGGDRMGGFAGGDRMGGFAGGDRMGGFAGGERLGGFAGGDRMGGFTGGDRMGGNGGFTPGGRMAGGFTPGSRMTGNGGFTTGGGRTGRFNMDLLQPTGQRVKRDVLHITQKGKKTFVTVTDVKGNRKAGASAGCLEDRKGRSRLARYAGEATGEHMGRAARKMGIKSVVVRVKGYSFFRKKKKIVLGFADGFRGERVRTPTPIMYIHDVTQLAHNGCRLPKKTRK